MENKFDKSKRFEFTLLKLLESYVLRIFMNTFFCQEYLIQGLKKENLLGNNKLLFV